MKWNRVLLALSLGLLVAAQSLSTTPTTTPAVQTLQSSQVSSATTAASQSKASGGADSGATQSDPGFEDPNEAGASGSDSGAFTMSKGGLIAIVTVVSVVAVFGSKSRTSLNKREKERTEKGSLDAAAHKSHSWISHPLVPRQKAIVGSTRLSPSHLPPFHRPHGRFKIEAPDSP